MFCEIKHINPKVILVEINSIPEDLSFDECEKFIISEINQNTIKVIFKFNPRIFVSSPFVGWLLKICEQLAEKRKNTYITGLSELSYKVFELVGIFLFSEYVKSIDEILTRE